MKEEEEEEEKGLFTFYKEQQTQQELLRLKFKKHKNKNKKSKRRLKSQIKSSEKNVSVIIEDNQEDQDINPKQALQHFLKNIRHQSPDISKSINSVQKSISNRLKTEPNSECTKPKENSMRAIKKTKVLSQLSQKYNFLPPKEFSPLSQPQFSPIGDLLNACKQKFYNEMPLYPQSSSHKSEEYEREKKKLLERLKSLQVKNKSNLISSRDSLNLRESTLKQRPQSENKDFFDHVANNANDGDKSAYRLLKEALKLPQIKKQALQMETISPSSSRRRLVIAAKNMPYQRKQLRLRHSNERRRQFYKLNMMAELTQSKSLVDGPTINLIDMGKDYKREETNTQQWHIKRKLIKSKLGIEL